MNYVKGRGAQFNEPNRFAKMHIDTSDPDAQDEALFLTKPKTEIFFEHPKKIISHHASPDIKLTASLNPYQGCEHGCIYCYARNSHEYWGFSAGLDFETKIIVKPDAPRLLERTFLTPSYQPKPFMLSGNTDCYQPLEKKFELTREILKICLKYRHPVAIITKNALVTRDIDILQELAKYHLVSVTLSITSMNEDIRRILEPRTSSATKKFLAIKQLSNKKIPVGIMNAPIIPAINHHETPAILKEAANNGAQYAGYTVVRLNGQIHKLFKDWLKKNLPNRADKVWHQIQQLHGGSVNDNQFGRRIKGDGPIAKMIQQLFTISKRKYLKNGKFPILNQSLFRKNGHYTLFP